MQQPLKSDEGWAMNYEVTLEPHFTASDLDFQ
jgi:hypothetical protein